MVMLRLGLVDFGGPARWRWRLTDFGGLLLAEHRVELDTSSWQYQALGDLHGYLRSHAVPDQRLLDETRIVRSFGRWLGEHVFGAVGSALAGRAPATVEVVVPAAARVVAYYPLECAVVAAQTEGAEKETLARLGVSLVLHVGDGLDRDPKNVGDRLRILGLFSAPDGTGALNLRKEREELRALAEQFGRDRAVDLEILQYGVTRQRLCEVVGEGWDIVHVSGHGSPGALLLERADGTPDPTSGDELAALLAPTSGRLKLVTVSTCSSAALVTAEQLHQLGLGPPLPADNDVSGQVAPALAVTLTEQLDCAVLAMRFKVVEDFAAALTTAVYRDLIENHRTLPEALRTVLPPLAPRAPTPRSPALAVATPALFGARAADAVFHAPPRLITRPPDEERQPGELPPTRPHYVGRVAVLARAGAALAPESGVRGVLLHGMAGIGTTSCALELARTRRGSFRSVAWYSVPRDESDRNPRAAALAELTAILCRALPGSTPDKLTDAAQLAELLGQHRILVVIDNADALLSADGQWPPPWRDVLGALTTHAGPGRLIVTSRRPIAPAELRVEAVHALSQDESMLLASELPHLRTLMDDGSEPALALLTKVLDQARGHPALLELADGQAADPSQLDMLHSEPGQDYAAVLADWTERIVVRLHADVRHFLFLLCALEEVDRDFMLAPTMLFLWPEVWKLAGMTGEPPDSGRLLDTLTDYALVAIDLLPPKASQLLAAGLPPKASQLLAASFPAGAIAGARMHPIIRAVARRLTPPGFQTAVDTAMERTWVAVAEAAKQGGEATGQLTVAARSALPYLARLGHWDQVAGYLLEVASRDSARTTITALMPFAERLVSTTKGTEGHLGARRVQARLAYQLDHQHGLAELRQVLDEANDAKRPDVAYLVAGDLVNAHRAVGQLTEALRMAELRIELGHQAGCGPWTRLANERDRLRIIDLQGKHGAALIDADRMLHEADSLPEAGSADEMSPPWMVRELLLNTASAAASGTRQWELALEYSEWLAHLQLARDAYGRDLATTHFNSAAALRKLGRLDEALAVLEECREVFEAHDDLTMLGKVLDLLSAIERDRGHHGAVLVTRAGLLRIAYRSADALAIAGEHSSYALALDESPTELAEKAAHHLAAAVIRSFTGNGELWSSLFAMAALLDRTELPSSPDALTAITDQLDGANLGGLLRRLEPDPRERLRKFEVISTAARKLVTLPASRSADSTPPQAERLPGLPPRPAPRAEWAHWLEHKAPLVVPNGGGLGILLHGMPGVGKTAIALEIVYKRRDAFRSTMWISVPSEGPERALACLKAAAGPGTLVVLDGADQLRAPDGTLLAPWTEVLRAQSRRCTFIVTSRLPISAPGLRAEALAPLAANTNNHREEHDEALAAWTAEVLSALPTEAELFFQFLCALELADRSGPYFGWTISVNWTDVWRRSGHSGEAPEPGRLLHTLARRALVMLSGLEDGSVAAVTIHPPIARLVNDPAFQQVVDEELAGYWPAVAEDARHRRGSTEATDVALLAARSALPYQLRLKDWAGARESIQSAVTRDRTPGNAQALLPAARELVVATTGTSGELPARHTLARVTQVANKAVGLVLSRRVLDAAVAAGNWALASVAAEDVIAGCRENNRPAEALEVAEHMPEYSRLGGYGPWTQLADERTKLAIRADLGQYAEVLADVADLLAKAEALPTAADDNEAVVPEQVRELICTTGADAAVHLGEWETALRYLDQELSSQQQRGAPAHDRSVTRFGMFGPLRALGRVAEARAMAVECQEVFVAAGDMQRAMLAQQALAGLDKDG